MKVLNCFVLVVLSIICVSCFVLPNSKKGFDVYKKEITQEANVFKINTNGVYLPVNQIVVPFFFFENGSVEWYGWADDFRLKPTIDSDFNKFHRIYSSRNFWGHFRIHNDTIIIQAFSRNNQEFFKRYVVEFKGVIKSDTSFVLLSGYNYHDKRQFIDKPITYQFYPTALKPDSTKAWFNNKRWFKKGLHESRKPKAK